MINATVKTLDDFLFYMDYLDILRFVQNEFRALCTFLIKIYLCPVLFAMLKGKIHKTTSASLERGVLRRVDMAIKGTFVQEWYRICSKLIPSTSTMPSPIQLRSAGFGRRYP